MILTVYGVGSAPPSTVALAAERFGGCTFVVDPGDRAALDMVPVLEHLGPVVVADRVPDVVEALAGVRPAGVVVFAEANLRFAAELTTYFGLPGVTPAVAVRLTDKIVQRARLNELGLGSVRSVPLDGGVPPAEPPLPAVVKPRAGAGSEDTVIVHTAAELVRAVERLDPGRPYVVEEYLRGAEEPLGPWLADYLSVESAVDAHGRITHLGLTGRLPLAPPARETGLVFPIHPPPELADAVAALAESALTGLGFRAGLAHTEIKLTARGPVVIEVNGRLGGGLHRLMPTAGGVEPVELAIALSAGQPVPGHLPVPDQHALHHYVQPPVAAVSVAELPGPRELRILPGVFGADRIVGPGGPVDWRKGSASRVYDVWLHAKTLPELAECTALLSAFLTSSIRWDNA